MASLDLSQLYLSEEDVENLTDEMAGMRLVGLKHLHLGSSLKQSIKAHQNLRFRQ